MPDNTNNTQKKYLDLGGLSYYDGKLKKWVGDQLTSYSTEANAKFTTLDAFNTHVGAFTEYKTNNDAAVKYSTDLWTAFLEGLTSAAPTLKDIKTFIDTTVPGTYATKDSVTTAIADLANVYVSETDFASAKDEITNSVKAVADDLAGYKTSNDAALKVVSDKATANATAIETLKTGLSGAVHFIGVYEDLPASANNGDIVIVNSTEYVYVVSGEGESVTARWEKLGDTTSEQGQITELTDALNNYKTSNDTKVEANTTAITNLTNSLDNYVKVDDFITDGEIDTIFNSDPTPDPAPTPDEEV